MEVGLHLLGEDVVQGLDLTGLDHRDGRLALKDVRSLVGQERGGKQGERVVAGLPDHLDLDVGVDWSCTPRRSAAPPARVPLRHTGGTTGPSLILSCAVTQVERTESGEDDRATGDGHRLDERAAIDRHLGEIPGYPRHG